MSISKVRSALVEHFISLNLGLPTAYDNVSFNPPDGSPIWLDLSFMPASSNVSTLGEEGLDYVSGILQIAINSNRNIGEGDLLDVVDSLKIGFTAGKECVYSNQSVLIESCSNSQGFVANNYFRMPVSVIWSAFIKRAKLN